MNEIATGTKGYFNYGSYTEDTRTFVKLRTNEIKALVRKSAEDIIDIGLKLQEVKDRLPHGDFGDWLEAEFAWSWQTANNFMNVAAKFQNVGNLDGFAATALYALSSPSAPPEAREEALQRAQEGEPIGRKQAKEIIDEHKERAQDPAEPNYVPVWELEKAVRNWLDIQDAPDLEPTYFLEEAQKMGRAFGALESHLGNFQRPYRRSDVVQAANNILEQYRQKEEGFPHQHDAEDGLAHEDGSAHEDAKSDSVTDLDEDPQPEGYPEGFIESRDVGARWEEWNVKSGWTCRGCGVERDRRAAGWTAYRHRPTGNLLCPACFEKERRTPGSVINAERDPGTPTDRVSAAILHSSEDNEWYTPEEYVDAVWQVMGKIDLDPASCAYANETVEADNYYTEEEDGLSVPWSGRVFLNPPYGKENGESNQARWSHYLIDQYLNGDVEEAILLVNATPGNRWWAPLWDFPICFVARRIHFYNGDGQSSQATHSNAFVYLGRNGIRFARIFKRFGPVVLQVLKDDD